MLFIHHQFWFLLLKRIPWRHLGPSLTLMWRQDRSFLNGHPYSLRDEIVNGSIAVCNFTYWCIQAALTDGRESRSKALYIQLCESHSWYQLGNQIFILFAPSCNRYFGWKFLMQLDWVEKLLKIFSQRLKLNLYLLKDFSWEWLEVSCSDSVEELCLKMGNFLCVFH